jgi:hypothetical protein
MSEIASTIRKQIGTDAWFAVSGRDAKWWTNDKNEVVFAFRFGSSYGLQKWCEITYRAGSDDYAIKAYKIHRNGSKRILSIGDGWGGIETAEWDGVYWESLGAWVRQANQLGELA